ncbi:MAG: hypothetical protein L6R28_08905 [Planctomycetes bacterium]|nr:hypothetical protein [Planctomycetota bacterium]
MRTSVLLVLLAVLAPATAHAMTASEEFKIKREDVFEFAAPPKVTRAGDRVEITFESKGYCDVTVAIEESTGTIVRHLASGVLGSNAPAPFAKDSLAQKIVWDGKDDLGKYVDDKDNCIVRVSLGLKPQFERTLFWSPKKRIGPGHRPLFASAEEGTYIFEGGGVDHGRLFDHQGNYIRTVYPFPPDYSSAEAKSNGPDALKAALAGVKNLSFIQLPQDGRWFPEWQGLLDGTLLTSGSNFGKINPTKYGMAASALALRPGKPGNLALVMYRLNRLATDGTTGGLPMEGPKTTVEIPNPGKEPDPMASAPMSVAFSNDGKWLYMTGYVGSGYANFMPCVMRMAYDGDKPAELFLGSLNGNEHKKDDAHFCCPLWVTTDAQGRVYVADYGNDRIQVFAPDGKFYKSVPTRKPVRVFVHPRNGHIYVASWLILSRHLPQDIQLPAVYTHLGPVDDPKQIASSAIPFESYSPGIFMNRTSMSHDFHVDFHTEPPTVWLVPGSGDSTEKLMQLRRDYSKGQWQFSRWSACHIRLLTEKGGKLVESANWAKDVAEAITRIDPPAAPSCERQRLYVNPKTGKLWVMEGDTGVGQACNELMEIDPDNGKVRVQRVPYSTEEIAFDLNGLIYLRTDLLVGRYDPRTWREVPWDYGEEIDNPGFDGDGRPTNASLPMPGTGRPGCFHLGGFDVSPKGYIAVSCYNVRPTEKLADVNKAFGVGKAYMPQMYPGRLRWAEVHVWDKHGQPVYKDAVPGMPMTDGICMDRDDNIYALVAARRVLDDGQPFPLECAEVLMKFRPNKAKFLSTNKDCQITLPKEMYPKRNFDLAEGFGGNAWVEGAEWMYGGVGVGGFIPNRGNICACWNARFGLDLYARSFAAELGRSSIAILDTNGNLIMRTGRYGNVDYGMPIVKDGGPADPIAIGGDEVALARPAYVATHSDRRLFIADYGSYRMLSVKLGYHAESKTALKDVPDTKGE